MSRRKTSANLVLYRNCNVSLAAHILTRCCHGDELSQSAYAQKFFPQACDVQVKGRMVKPSLVFE
ncbi:hypothetical protein [Phascolarctobacterium succinatutens]|uniref:hypothetical protein n=1 Tax=Phascolarctobacterium succinatutens TaxID=626940 RepID=UPI003C6E0410